MKDETVRPQSDMDVLKFYIWLMVVMTLMLAGIFWWLVWVKLDDTQKNLTQGKAWMKDFAQQQSEIEAMLSVHRNNKEDIARDAPQTWFSSIWRRKGINDASLNPGSWKNAAFNAKGKFYEEQIDMNFNQKAPLPRQSIAEFCHEIEKSSTRLRIIELDIRRADKDNFDKDEWGGHATIGYRHATKD